MITFWRRIGESIRIGNNIKVTPTHIVGKQVRIAVLAPVELSVDREEIYIKKQNSAVIRIQIDDVTHELELPPGVMEELRVNARTRGLLLQDYFKQQYLPYLLNQHEEKP